MGMRRIAIAWAAAFACAAAAEATTSSPDAWGYCWTDAVAFSWYDAATGGTALTNAGDVNFGFVNMPFTGGAQFTF